MLFIIAFSLPISADEDQDPHTRPGRISFPKDDVFQPLIADPKQEQFYASVLYFDPEGDEGFLAGVVGFGETLGLIRWAGESENDGLQISIIAGVFAQFNLEAESHDLLNADYTAALAGTYRRGPNSMRVRLYHQSTHLGDELLLGDEELQENRVNFSFEALEIIGSRNWGEWRGYAGGSYLIHREPGNLQRAGLRGGVEYHGIRQYWLGSRLIGGLDIKSSEHHDWEPSTSLKAGMEFGKPWSGNRRLRFMLEGYRGFVPYGQFYDLKMTSYGAGIYLSF